MIPINNQSPQKTERHPLGWLYVHSIFYTIQGEGPHAGKPAVFVRLAGCNLQCPGCDTEYTKGAKLMTPADICREADLTWLTMYDSACAALARRSAPLIVITGGEPFRQNLGRLIDLLHADGRMVQIETNGTLWDSRIPHYEHFTLDLFNIVCSPKAGKVAIPEEFITAYKYVVSYDAIDHSDGLPTSVLGMPASPARPSKSYAGPIYVQPAEGGTAERKFANHLHLSAAIDSSMRFGHTLCLQTHKMVGLP